MEPPPAWRIARTAHVPMKIDRIAAGAADLRDYCLVRASQWEALRLARRQERGLPYGGAGALFTDTAFYGGFDNQGTDLASPFRSQVSERGLC